MGYFNIIPVGQQPVFAKIVGVEIYIDGTWKRKSVSWKQEQYVPPFRPLNLHVDPPRGTNKWRCIIKISQPQRGVRRIVPQLRIFWARYRGGMPFETYWSDGSPIDGPEAVTWEIEP